jgi:hypothetical protein
MYCSLAVQTARRNLFAGRRSEPKEATTPGVPRQSLLERIVDWSTTKIDSLGHLLPWYDFVAQDLKTFGHAPDQPVFGTLSK